MQTGKPYHTLSEAVKRLPWVNDLPGGVGGNESGGDAGDGGVGSRDGDGAGGRVRSSSGSLASNSPTLSIRGFSSSESSGLSICSQFSLAACPNSSHLALSVPSYTGSPSVNSSTTAKWDCLDLNMRTSLRHQSHHQQISEGVSLLCFFGYVFLGYVTHH